MYWKLVNCIVLTISISINLESQNISSFTLKDTVLANKYNALADTLLIKFKYDSSIYYLKKAAEIYESLAYNLDKDELWSKYVNCRYPDTRCFHYNELDLIKESFNVVQIFFLERYYFIR